MAVALATFELGLKQAPLDGWLSPRCLALFAASVASTWGFATRTLKAAHPVVDGLERQGRERPRPTRAGGAALDQLLNQ